MEVSLLVKAADRCQTLMVSKIHDLKVQDVEADQIWGYVGKKEGHKSDDDGAEVGDAYSFVGMERHTKLVLAYHLGKRNAKVQTNSSASWLIRCRVRILRQSRRLSVAGPSKGPDRNR
jgi:hypothetical protein